MDDQDLYKGRARIAVCNGQDWENGLEKGI